MKTIYRVMKLEDWELQSKSKFIIDASLELEGFIHCCFEDQLVHVMSNYFFTGDKLVLLELDQNLIGEPLKIEASTAGELFPHIYSPIPKNCIRQIQQMINPF